MSGAIPAKIRCTRLLVVDDDRVNRKVLTRILEIAGYVVDTAESAEKAMLLALERYDAIVCELDRPGVSGKTFVEVTNRVYGGLAPPFVFVTCESPDVVSPHACVRKPFRRIEIIEAIRGACRQRPALSAIRRNGE